MTPYYEGDGTTLFLGDCRDVMAQMAPESVDAIVTDPPYGLEFMGKEWDRLQGSVSDGSFKDFKLPSILGSRRNVKCPECHKWIYDWPNARCQCGGVMRYKQREMQAWHHAWALEALRVLRPGGHMVAMGSSRTHHRLFCAIEDAGFEIRDTICYLFGSGFPKSRNVSRDLAEAVPPYARCACALHLTDRETDSQGDCRPERGLDDEPPHGASDSVQASSPSQGDALGHSHADQYEDGRGYSQGHSPDHSRSVRPSSDCFENPSYSPSADSPDADNVPCDRSLNTLNSEGGKAGDRSPDRISDIQHSGGDSAVSSWQPPSGASQYYHICPICGKWGVAQGFGTALKPAVEFICLARKPIERNVAHNVQKHGTGALNVDGCRIGIGSSDDIHAKNPHTRGGFGHAGASVYGGSGGAPVYNPSGRWPANLVLECTCEETLPGPPEQVRQRENEPSQDKTYNTPVSFGIKPGARRSGGGVIHTDPNCPCAMLDAQSGESVSAGGKESGRNAFGQDSGWNKHDNRPTPIERPGDSGGASRFYYTSKAGSDERGGTKHPTVKPRDLMLWLCKLVTPPNGLILDPFIGSGTTAVAARMGGFRCVGIDNNEEYLSHAAERLRLGDEGLCQVNEARKQGSEQGVLW